MAIIENRVDSVRRGGSWDNSNAYFLRSAYRYCYYPTLRYYGLGFRCVFKDNPMSRGVVRGVGGWINGCSSNLRSATRNWHHPNYRNNNLGFRLIFKNGGYMSKLEKNKELIKVPSGTFLMGDNNGHDDEKPALHVQVEGFYITPYPITVKEFCNFLNDQGKVTIEKLKKWISVKHSQIEIEMNATHGDNVLNKATPKPGKETQPIVEVSWYGARAFCEWADGELPTEEQWEYVAKWGNKKEYGNSKYPLGNEFCKDDYCFDKPSIEDVGNYPANGIGIYDLGGLVWEWCLDEYDPDAYRKKIENAEAKKEPDKKRNPKMMSSTKLIAEEGGYIVVEIDGEPVIIRR